MTDKDKLDSVIDAMGRCYHSEMRQLAAFPNDLPTKLRLSGMLSIIMHSGLDWIKEDQRWNEQAGRDAKQSATTKISKGVYGDRGNE